MVVNNAVEKLLYLGYTEYEAKSYLALLGTNPATPYEIAKLSGIPTSKIYEVISRLLVKGLISPVEAEKKIRYIPLKPHELIERKRVKLESTLDSLELDLDRIGNESDLSYIWNIHDYDYLMEKSRRIIEEAGSELLLSGWDDELSQLSQLLKRKEKENVNISIIHFGKPNIGAGHIFQHPIEDTLYAEKGGRGFVVIADSREALMGTVSNENKAEGAWSMNSGFVTLAEDYIKHDIYIMKIVRRFDYMLKKRFGAGYEKLRDIFNDEEER